MINTNAHIEVIQSGLSTSIQDMGRFGYFSEGIPIAGSMDKTSAGLANLIVGNQEKEALVEWSILPPKLRFSKSAYIACTGAQVEITVNQIKIDSYKNIYVPANGTLTLKLISGIYGYIAIKGGIKIKKVLNSRSWFKGITSEYLFKKNMQIPYLSTNEKLVSTSKVGRSHYYKDINKIKVFKGPEYELLTSEQRKKLNTQKFSTSQIRDRMGIQLSESLDFHTNSILSSPTLPGTVQWTPSGQLIVLMRNAQTIGGYPRILQLTENSISIIAQMDAKQLFYFELI